MQSLSSTRHLADRSLELVSQFVEAAAALAVRSVRHARTEKMLRDLSDEQLDDAGIDRPARRPQSARDALLMSELMSLR